MPLILPPAGAGGLPSLSTRAFQLVDAGYPVWTAFWTALNEYLNALVEFFGSEAASDIGQIGA